MNTIIYTECIRESSTLAWLTCAKECAVDQFYSNVWGPVDPFAQLMIIFHSVLSLICVCGSIGHKLNFTAKNIAIKNSTHLLSET